MKLGVIVVSLSVCLSSMVLADDEVVRRLSGYHFEDEVWNYIPVHDPETGFVDAIVAIAKPDATIGDNLNTVMFIREGNEFEAWSWRNTTRGRAVYSAKMILGVSDEDDANWLLEEELPWLDDNALRPPTPYLAGMLTDDPLFEPVMESENPAALISMLQEIGYPVALLRPSDGGGETGEPCTDSAELRPMLDSVEWAMTQNVEDEASNLAVLNQIASQLVAAANLCAGRCNPYTRWVFGQVIKGGCTWEAITPIPVWFPTPSGPVLACQYRMKRSFVQDRLRVRVYSDCSYSFCTQYRDGFAWSPIYDCTAFTPNPAGACVVPPPAPCANWAAPCSSLYPPTAWTMWTPDCPY